MGWSANDLIRCASLRRAAVFVVLTAYACSAFVPVGWMPAAMAGETNHYIVICTVSGLKTVAVDSDGKPSEEEPFHGSDHSGKICAYGAAPKHALDTGDLVLLSLGEAVPHRMHFSADPLRASKERYANYAPRAPPTVI